MSFTTSRMLISQTHPLARKYEKMHNTCQKEEGGGRKKRRRRRGWEGTRRVKGREGKEMKIRRKKGREEEKRRKKSGEREEKKTETKNIVVIFFSIFPRALSAAMIPRDELSAIRTPRQAIRINK